MAYQKYICVISVEWVPLLTRLITLLQNLPNRSYFQNKDKLIMEMGFYSYIHPLIILINVIYGIYLRKGGLQVSNVCVCYENIYA